MSRVQITLTGEKAENFLERKKRLEETLGYEMSRPQALMLLMNSAVNDDPIQQNAKL